MCNNIARLSRLARISYYFWNEIDRRMCGYSIIEQENWDQQQAFFYSSRPTLRLTMVRINDPALLEVIRTNGPQNYTIADDGTPNLLPPIQRNLAAQFIVISDDQLMMLNSKMDQQIDLTKKMLATLTAMAKAVA